MGRVVGPGVWVPFVLVLVTGCGALEDLDGDGGGSSEGAIVSEPDDPAADDPPSDDPANPPPPEPDDDLRSPRAVPADFSGVEWLHADVSDWAETASLEVEIGDGVIRLEYDKARVWHAVDGLNANPWIFVFRDGRWYAATFEWFRFGQTTKPTSTVAGDHIKKPPLHDFRPVSGERYGFMVSGLARDSKRNVFERTRVVMKRWP